MTQTYVEKGNYIIVICYLPFHIYYGAKRLGAKRLVGRIDVGAKRLGGKRLVRKRLGGETTRGVVWGRNLPDSVQDVSPPRLPP